MTDPADNDADAISADTAATDEVGQSTPEPRNLNVGTTYNVEFDFTTGEHPS